MVILGDDRAVSQPLELARVPRRRPVARIPLRVEQLGRPMDAGAALADPVDLSLPASPQKLFDHVLVTQNATALEVEAPDLRVGNCHLPPPSKTEFLHKLTASRRRARIAAK